MNAYRTIRKVMRSRPTIEGAGVHLVRAFGFSEAPLFDPFLLLDDFHSNSPEDYLPGFPWHPHRGIETITYVLAGKVDHGDSMGNKGVIGAGEVQWMTAGSGIIHQEMPAGNRDNLLSGFQLWANLPASHKMMKPRYREITSSQIPRVTTGNGVSIMVICGKVREIRGPVQDIVSEPEYLDISIPKGSEFLHPTRPEDTVFAYVISGSALFSRETDPFSYESLGQNYFDLKKSPRTGAETVVLYNNGSQLAIRTEDDPVHFLLISGKPLREPVAWHGPIVMNTRDELRVAFEEYQTGRFIK